MKVIISYSLNVNKEILRLVPQTEFEAAFLEDFFGVDQCYATLDKHPAWPFSTTLEILGRNATNALLPNTKKE